MTPTRDRNQRGDFERAPDDIVALNRLGRAYEALGRSERAKSAFRRVLECDPTNSIASRRLGALERTYS